MAQIIPMLTLEDLGDLEEEQDALPLKQVLVDLQMVKELGMLVEMHIVTVLVVVVGQEAVPLHAIEEIVKVDKVYKIALLDH